MMDSDKKTMAKWVETRKRAGTALKEVKRQELHIFDYARNQKMIDEMLQWAHDHRKVRLTSGLVEMQRYFMKMRERRLQGKS
jgi:hypothetical protein